MQILEGLRLGGTEFGNVPSDWMRLRSWTPQKQLGREDTRNSLCYAVSTFLSDHFHCHDTKDRITEIVAVHSLSHILT